MKLPLSFDAEALKADLDQIPPNDWTRHFNDRYYEGEWSGVALRAIEGDPARIYPDPTKPESFADTPVLARCSSIRLALAALQCPVKSARLLKLGSGSRIIEHRDYNLSLEDAEIRLHIPITTGPLVEFYLNGERIVMKEGECWYINANLPHKVENYGDVDRVHLVIDCAVDDWLLALVASSEHVKAVAASPSINKCSPSSPEALNRFCNLVFDDLDLRDRLSQVRDKRLFIDLVVRLGQAHDCRFNREDVEAALRANRRAWIERWV